MDADRLASVLEHGKQLGFLGPGPVAAHIEHAGAFTEQLPRAGRVLDLGSGGGVPGLVVATARPDLQLVLLDSMERRGRFLVEAVDQLDLGDRVEVVVERAERAARRLELRHGFEVVMSRSFGPPAVTAECAVGFLRPPDEHRPGGVLLVSEPPSTASGRWSVAVLGELSLDDEGVRGDDGAHLRRLRSLARCDPRYPRRVGLPAKRPMGGAS